MSLPLSIKSPKTLAARNASDPGKTPIRVALTFDDLPAHDPLQEGESLLDVPTSILRSLANHEVSGVYGFINGAKLAEHADGRQVLEAWRDAGQPANSRTSS